MTAASEAAAHGPLASAAVVELELELRLFPRSRNGICADRSIWITCGSSCRGGRTPDRCVVGHDHSVLFARHIRGHHNTQFIVRLERGGRGADLALITGSGMPSCQLSPAESAGGTALDRALFPPGCLQTRNDATQALSAWQRDGCHRTVGRF